MVSSPSSWVCAGWKRWGGIPGVVDWKHRVPSIYPGQGGDVGDSDPDLGSPGGKGQLEFAFATKVHRGPPGDGDQDF